jgi:hypothetical protein
LIKALFGGLLAAYFLTFAEVHVLENLIGIVANLLALLCVVGARYEIRSAKERNSNFVMDFARTGQHEAKVIEFLFLPALKLSLFAFWRWMTKYLS